jgi:ElaB/YqjD/DUF883 family membrane-anchored ribosome-binding protein
MEQEVEVTIHRGETANSAEEPQQRANIPERLKELGEMAAEAISCFRESDSYERLMESTQTTRLYIKKNPASAMLVSLSAGFLLGLIMKRGR